MYRLEGKNTVTPHEVWNTAHHQLSLLFDRPSFDMWLKNAVLMKYDTGVYEIGVPTAHAQDMLQHRYYRNIQRVVEGLQNEPVQIRFVVYVPPALPMQPDLDDDAPLLRLIAQHKATHNQAPASLHEAIQPVRLPDSPEVELNPRYTFDRFLNNKANQLAYEAALSVAEHPATQYNPFLIYGDVGLGKTHLLQAIGHVCRAKGLRTLYVPTEVFTNELINAIRHRTNAMFREKYRTADVLLLDDVQFLIGKESTQEEFFHTFNTLVNFNRQVVIVSDRHPREMTTLEDRLRSRFQGGLVADMQPPELETRIAIVRMWARERRLDLQSDVIATIAERAPNNIRELEGAFNQVAAQTRLAGASLPLQRVATTLERFMQPRERPSVKQIIEQVAVHHDLAASDLTGSKRLAHIAEARQIAMYLARELTDETLHMIGSAFGRAHSTVLHSYNKISIEITHDRLLEARLARIRKSVTDGDN